MGRRERLDGGGREATGRNEGAVDTHHGGIQPGVEDDGGGGGGDGRASAMDGGWSDGSGEWDEGRRMKGRA